jgi:hypothetical protein
MDRLIARVKAIMLTPQAEWLEIAREPGEPAVLFLRYVAPLAAIPALARFIGSSLIGGYTPVVFGLVGAVVFWLMTFGVVYVLAFVIEMLGPRFGGRRDFQGAFKLSVYSYTPVWLAGIFLLVPGLSFLTILGLYGLYLLWLGMPLLVALPRDKALGLAGVVMVCAVILQLLVAVLQMTVFS